MRNVQSYLDEFRLHCGRMDTLLMEERFYILRHKRVLGGILTANMSGGNYPIFGQLPNVKFVQVKYSVHLVK